ncbi:ArnT family glycosyltransferase [Geomesophilobacter sediminis]|uniref:Glycosyltransferase family 39 protein n=1 Tax=Geomesophilobacter sediminis TaxID=2798584 RepID=A0A8J7SA72_9BACT|nr:glycosyltransferase family 39 protein [Geomesophilobacter sediminis]MBJ6727300.1 glycosyltransferase family 39 protein [Geomesophilobacter sediminis]
MSAIALLLPVACCAALLRDRLREDFVKGAVALGLFVVFATEILSLFKAIAFVPVVSLWVLFLAGIVAWRRSAKRESRPFFIPQTTIVEKLTFALIAAIVVITGVTAVVAAPNNFDSLTYHLPRVMHWVQNRSVAHYPTNCDRQLVLAPFSEFGILQLQVLAGSDRFANCVQWFAMIGSAVGVSLIARELKGSRTAQFTAAALAVSLPMGLLQATSTQNDYTVTLWIVTLIWFMLRAREDHGLANAAAVGMALGLAIFTKGTAYMIAAPLMAVYLWIVLRQGVKGALLSLAVVAAAVLLINAGHFARNVSVYGNPLSPGTGNDILSKKFTPAAVASGVTKNLVSQLGGEPAGVNRVLYLANRAVHGVLGVDANDPALSSDEFLVLPAQVKYHEDYAPNPLHLLLIMAAAAVLAVGRKKLPVEAVLLFGATLAGFVILSGCLKWTLYLSRYFIAFFVVMAPLVAVILDGPRQRSALAGGALILLLLSFPVLTFNQMRPLVGPQSVFSTDRIDQYFKARPEAKPYLVSLVAMAHAQPNHNVGLINHGGNVLEYLVWVLLNDGTGTYRIEHLDVDNASGKIKLEGFTSWYPIGI